MLFVLQNHHGTRVVTLARQSARRTIQTIEAGSIKLGERTLPVTVRVDRRAKRLIMRVEPSGRVRVTCPHKRDVSAALAMAESRREWIGSRLDEMPSPIPFCHGTWLPVLGRERQIVRDPSRRSTVLEEGHLFVEGIEAKDPTQSVIRTLKREVQVTCRHRAEMKAAMIGVSLGRIRVRDMKTRWGSCTASGDLTFNWRLAHAPLAVLDYVVAHEVAHRRYMDHSPAFWSLVKTMCPDYHQHEVWLRDEGRGLFCYGASLN